MQRHSVAVFQGMLPKIAGPIQNGRINQPGAGLGLIHAFRKIRDERLGYVPHGGWCEPLAVIGRHETERGLATGS